MTLNVKIKYKKHVKKKLDIKFRQMFWFLGYNSKMSIQNKLLIYNHFLKTTCTYDIQI